MTNNELSTTFKEITGKDFNTFYTDYRPKLVYYLTRYTKNQEISEDFADDAFTQALLKIKSFNSEKAQIHTWIYKIGENLVIKDFKDKQRLSMVSIDKNDENNLNIANLLSYDYSKDLEEELLLKRKTEIIYEAIDNLPEKYKTVMEMREIKKMSYVSISETCTKEHNLTINGKQNLPHPKEFLDLEIDNQTKDICSITFTYQNGQKIELYVVPNEYFTIDNEEIENLSGIVVSTSSDLNIKYRTFTNLATIKSQIRAGRELIRNMIKNKFKQLENDDLY